MRTRCVDDGVAFGGGVLTVCVWPLSQSMLDSSDDYLGQVDIPWKTFLCDESPQTVTLPLTGKKARGTMSLTIETEPVTLEPAGELRLEHRPLTLTRGTPVRFISGGARGASGQVRLRRRADTRPRLQDRRLLRRHPGQVHHGLSLGYHRRQID
jgi:hypothetical protein